MKKQVRIVLISLFTLLNFSFAIGQQIEIRGSVSDQQSKETLAGVTISVQGTQQGTQTDERGNFSIFSGPNAQLLFSHVGYTSQLINVSNRTSIHIVLQAAETIDEVLIVGYGEQRRRISTQSVSTINESAFKNLPMQSPQQLLQGQAAGVNMINSSGVLGSEAQITVRGGSSISGGGRPLYVIDGVPLNVNGSSYSQAQGSSTNINPLLNIPANDIESFTVLKDASAIAIYGSRGSNGVILITTKRGNRTSKPRIQADFYQGISRPTALDDMMNASEFIDYRTKYLEANNLDVPTYPTTSFDWLDAVVRTGKVKNTNLSASGGNESQLFYLGGNYTQEDGFTIGNDMEKLSGRFNFEQQLSDKVKVGVNYNVSHVDMNRIGLENNTYAPITAAYLQIPYITPYDENGQFINTGFVANVLAITETGINKTVVNRSTGNAFIAWDIFKGLTAKSDWGVDRASFDSKYRSMELLSPGGYAYRNLNTDNKWLTTNTLNYSTTFGQGHNFSALLGQSFETSTLTQIIAESQGFVSDDLPNVGSGATPISAGESIYDWALYSLFARANYNYQEKYLFEASVRRDGSSRFGANKRYGTFYALAGGWILSNEKFFNKDNDYLQFLKISASYGTAGNDNIGYYPYIGTFQGGQDYMGEPGISPSQVPNNNLGWEETAQLDIGISAKLFRVLDLQLNYYNKHTSELLLNVPYPYTTGFTSASQNVGTMRNRGFEVSLTSQNIAREHFSWTTNFNIGFNKNTVLSLPTNEDEYGRNFIAGSTYQRAIEGHSRNSFYLIRYAGINPESGDAEWLDKDGNYTISPTAEDRVIVGKGDPTFQGGITNTLRYKNFDFSAFFNFTVGNNIYFEGYNFSDNIISGSYNKSQRLNDYHQNPGDIAYAPALNSVTVNSFHQHSSKLLFNGSYLRLKMVTLGYSLPQSWLQKSKVFQSARIYALGQNLWVLKDRNLEGDPEISANGASNGIIGQSFFAIPQAKSFTIGINLGL